MLVILHLLGKQKGNIRQGKVGGDTVSYEKIPFTNLASFCTELFSEPTMADCLLSHCDKLLWTVYRRFTVYCIS